MKKIWIWIKANGASILGIIQAAIKALKEVLTAIVNLLSIFFPVIGSQQVVIKIRDFLNMVDEWIEKLKPYLIPVI